MLTLFSEVARPLLPAEVDANFSGLDDRLRGIERDGVRSVGIKDIVASDVGGTVLITLTDGQTVGPLNLPTTFFVPRGAWVTGTAYRQRDFVTVGGSSYVCRGPHTASADFATDLGNSLWQINSAQGKDGAPFAIFQGVYDPAKAYLAGDSVLYNDPIGGFVLFRAAFNAPAGKGPGSLNLNLFVPYWTAQSFQAPGVEFSHAVYGKPAVGTIWRRRLGRGVTLPTALTGSSINLGAATTAAFTVTLSKNGSAISTATIAAGGKTGAFTALASGVSPLVAGDILTLSVTAPSTQDATAADLDFSLLGTLS